MSLTEESWFTESELHEVEPPPWLLQGMLPLRSVNMLFGESNIGKTFVALDMAAHIAIGKPWLGREVEESDVLYIASEGDPGNLGLRMEAWREFHGIDFPVPILFYTDIVSLQHDARDLIDGAVARGLRPRLVIVDTLSMALDDNENDNKVMNDMIKGLRHVQTYEVDGETHELAWLLVHHVGWGDNGRPRGGSGMPAGLDFVMGIKPITEKTVELFSYKAKNAAKFMPLGFEEHEVADSIVLKYLPVEETKILKSKAKGTETSSIIADFQSWTYVNGPLADAGAEFTQAMFRKAFDLPDSKKSTVSNIFKDHVASGAIRITGKDKYVARKPE